MSKDWYKYSVLLLALVLTACSTQKNTWSSRSYHQTKVKYNIFFNGNKAYEEGQKNIAESAQDDYTNILNLYPVSDHRAAEAAASKMDVTIEKCRKCIKLHSIKAKPKPNPNRMSDPKYKAWLKQEEFNNQMGRVWIRLGEAEFHKGDFLGSIGTFTYVQKHYDYDPDIVAQCQLWMARAYAELGWLYEAEDLLRRVQVDDLKRKHASLYSSISADVLLKTGHYHEAIPFVKLALPYEDRKGLRPRFQYVLAQLLEREGKRAEAVESYGKVLKLTPPLEMEFNARIRKAELQGRSGIRSLEKLARQEKHKDRLDQVYGTMGHIWLHARDTATALENYELAIEKSTTAGPGKAAVLLTAGDLYFDRSEYAKAQPCYAEAITILSSESEDYRRVARRSEALDELIKASDVIILQDSLQHLSTLSEAEQRAIVEKIIANLIEQEKQDSIAAALADREAQNDGPMSVNTQNMLGGNGGSAEWYFYNPTLLKQGKQDFRKRWGNRTLEDNWRRQNKSVAMSWEEENRMDEGSVLTKDGLQRDSVVTTVARESDVHQPQYYLQQIPRTPEDFQRSDSLIADALFELIFIYQDKLCDTLRSQQTFDEFRHRFVADSRLPDLYYMYYLTALKQNNATEAERWRSQILAQFPETKQAKVVANPNYFVQLRRMVQEQDSLYETTYAAYKRGRFREVKSNVAYAETNYPLTELMPKFLFLKAIAVARTEGQTPFVGELQRLVEAYPESDMGVMAKEMLAMMGQGMETKKGSGATNLADQRSLTAEPEQPIDASVQFSRESKTESYILLYMTPYNEQALNDLLYEVALFNFSQFLIKDFDLQQLMSFEEGCALRIGGFESMDETAWYIGLMQQSELQNVLNSLSVEIYPITVENSNLIGKGLHLTDYKAFLKK